MAALRFDHGRLTGRVSNSRSLAVIYPNYPPAPVSNTAGWYFGKSAPDYTPAAQTPSLFKKTLFGTSKFEQAEVLSSSVPVGFFNGTLVYAFFYDRPLYDYELNSIYSAMRVKLLAERGIILHDTTPRNNFGTIRIQKRYRRTFLVIFTLSRDRRLRASAVYNRTTRSRCLESPTSTEPHSKVRLVSRHSVTETHRRRLERAEYKRLFFRLGPVCLA
jgi:hypothetical protein